MVDTAPVQGSPQVVLRCSDCGEVREIAGTRFTHPETPHDVLCQECWAFSWRWLDRTPLHPLGKASETDEDGTLWLRRTCPRCNGEGRVQPYPGTCFRCLGWRWAWVSPRNVNMVLKASVTFQANRIPRSQR
jgi:hypothetical protein